MAKRSSCSSSAAPIRGAGFPALGLAMRAQCGGCVETMLKAFIAAS